jgi:hypothetical protein
VQWFDVADEDEDGNGNGATESPTHLERIDLQIQILVLNKTVYPIREHALEVRLTRPAAGIGRHHPGDGGVGTEEGTELAGGFELGGEDGLRARGVR